jgi:hypothetical protein
VIRPVKRILDPRVACATFRGETDANGRSGRLLLVRTSGVIRPGSSHHECSRRIWPPHSPRVSPFHLISRNERSRPSASTGLMAARPSEHFRPGAVTGPARQEGCSACPRKRRAGRRGRRPWSALTAPARLVLLDHDQSVGPLVQRVELHAWFVVNPDDRRLASRDQVGAVLRAWERR